MPFDKVHTNLKRFPTQLYHKYNYYVSFYDDYTSSGWLMHLQRKSGTIDAIRHFIAMDKTHFGVMIRLFMSDAGGEYKSLELLNELKDLGI